MMNTCVNQRSYQLQLHQVELLGSLLGMFNHNNRVLRGEDEIDILVDMGELGDQIMAFGVEMDTVL